MYTKKQVQIDTPQEFEYYTDDMNEQQNEKL